MAHNAGRHERFSTKWYHRKPKYWFRKDRDREDGHRAEPEVVRLEVEPGVTPSEKPPVRIFLGTEPLQARAERVFIWSVKQHRDPSRVYEIYLMEDLKGFRREGWKTGFTNYRFAIPYLAGRTGKAIYNDVDQIYLADPSEMFDLPMNGAGALAIAVGEDSVMLIDCEKMDAIWPVEKVRESGNVKKWLRNKATDEKIWGLMPGAWNARDDEFVAGESKCFHFTTLQTQPWRPFPDQLHYADHKDGHVWHALERSSNAARYTPFTRERPSSGFAASRAKVGNGAPSASGDEARHASEIAKLVSATGAKTLLDVSSPSAGGARSFPGLAVSAPSGAAFAEPVTGRHDGVESIDALTDFPEDDVAWALNELFGAAERFVYVAVSIDNARTQDGAPALPGEWWRLQMELAANRNPGRRWALLTVDKTGAGEKVRLEDGDHRLAQAA